MTRQRVYLEIAHSDDLTLNVEWEDDYGNPVDLDVYDAFTWLFGSFAYSVAATQDNYITTADNVISLYLPKSVIEHFRGNGYGYHRLTAEITGDPPEVLVEGGIYFHD